MTGLWLSIYWEFHHPNWRTHIFQRGWNHQPVSDIHSLHAETSRGSTESSEAVPSLGSECRGIFVRLGTPHFSVMAMSAKKLDLFVIQFRTCEAACFQHVGHMSYPILSHCIPMHRLFCMPQIYVKCPSPTWMRTLQETLIMQKNSPVVRRERFGTIGIQWYPLLYD